LGLSVQGRHVSFRSKEDAVMQCVLFDFSAETFCTIVSTVYTAKWYYRTHRQKYLYIAQNTHQQFGPLHTTKRQLPWPIWINYGKAQVLARGNLITFSPTNISVGPCTQQPNDGRKPDPPTKASPNSIKPRTKKPIKIAAK
jgi:hypothetical protein